MKKKPSQSATDWLFGFLKLYPPKNTKTVEDIAEFMGYTKDELKKAKRDCRVIVGPDDIWRLGNAGKND